MKIVAKIGKNQKIKQKKMENLEKMEKLVTNWKIKQKKWKI